MTYVNLTMQPGIFSEASELTAGMSARWVDGELIRFYKGQPEPIGGWSEISLTGAEIVGKPRDMINWTTTAGVNHIAVGTSKKLYVLASNVVYDITPTRETGTLSNPFSTTAGLATVDVADTGHGGAVGDYVSFSGASAVGGITVDGEYTITSVTDADNYVITHSMTASSTAGPGGGASVSYEYDIQVPGEDVADSSNALASWTLSNWGEDLIATPQDDTIYVWDASAGTGTRATAVSNAPTTNKVAMVSPAHRHLIAFGAHDGSNDDPLFIRWCDQNDYTSWTPAETNTAGDLRLDRGQEIVGVHPSSKDEILVFTDTDLYSLRYIKPPLVYGLRHITTAAGIIATHAAASRGGVTWYMGEEDFFIYDGQLRVLPCDVRSYVFNSMNRTQRNMIYCGINSEWEEVWWFYPSATSEENDRCVWYNYIDNAWGVGSSLGRNCWIDRCTDSTRPRAFDDDGALLHHEDGSSAPARVWLESGDIQAETGDSFIFSDKIIPDFVSVTNGVVGPLSIGASTIDFYVKSKAYPHDPSEITKGPYSVTTSTQKLDYRIRGRQLAVYLESASGKPWRMSSLRMNVKRDGKKE